MKQMPSDTDALLADEDLEEAQGWTGNGFGPN